MSSSTGRTPKPTDKLEQVRAATDQLTAKDRQQKIRQMSVMTAVALRRFLTTYSIDDVSQGDAGIMKVLVFQALGLGLPPTKYWTTKSIRHILDSVVNVDYEPEQITKKDDAVAFLRDALRKREDKPVGKSRKRYDTSARTLSEGGQSGLARTCKNLNSYNETGDQELDEIIEDAEKETRNETGNEQETGSSSSRPSRKLFEQPDDQESVVDLEEHRIELMGQMRKVNEMLGLEWHQ